MRNVVGKTVALWSYGARSEPKYLTRKREFGERDGRKLYTTEIETLPNDKVPDACKWKISLASIAGHMDRGNNADDLYYLDPGIAVTIQSVVSDGGPTFLDGSSDPTIKDVWLINSVTNKTYSAVWLFEVDDVQKTEDVVRIRCSGATYGNGNGGRTAYLDSNCGKQDVYFGHRKNAGTKWHVQLL